jgi:hypothetical protein
MGFGSTKKNAKRDAINNIQNALNDIPDPCTEEMNISNIRILRPIITFEEPLFDEWFDEPQILGIDFEGDQHELVQIGCKKGIVIESFNEPWVQRVLHDKRHIHYIFGNHERNLVSNPFDMQRYLVEKFPIYKHEWSLVDGLSLMFYPSMRFTKDKDIHIYTEWDTIAYSKNINDFEKYYAAMDAFVTYKLATLIHRAQL